MQIPTVTVDQLPPDALLLDVREDDEWLAGHVDGAVHVPMTELPNRLADDPATVPADRPVFVVCKVGGRSARVTAWLNVDGGMLAWAGAGRPMVSDSGQPPEVI